MRRFSVVGTSCSGRSPIASRIADPNRIPHIELDKVFWQPNRTPLPLDPYRLAAEALAAGDEWVIDGNYGRVWDLVWARATDVVWMNLPLVTILWRVIKRTARRIVTREELFAGNRETFRNVLPSRDSLIWWVIFTHRGRMRALRKMLARKEYSKLNLHEVRKASDAISLLEPEGTIGYKLAHRTFTRLYRVDLQKHSRIC
jgi:adenylate kinase family enzyme